MINPPQRTELRNILGLKAPPIGLLYIAAYLEKAGLSVDVLDADLYDLTMPEITKEASSRNPNIIGVTATTGIVKSALNVVQSVKSAISNVVSVIGGAHPTFMPQQTLLDCPELDIVVRGEGEETMLELTDALIDFQWHDHHEPNLRFNDIRGLEFTRRISSVRGIAYRSPEHANEVVLTPPRPMIKNLDDIPLPARHLVPFDRYKLLGKDVSLGAIITSRGCPFNCTYCSSSRIVGKQYRIRSPENILQEMEVLRDIYRIDHIEFLDDIFTLDQKRVVKFSELVRARKLNIQWVASSRVNTVSVEALEAMKKAGLRMLYFGVESGVQRILNLMRKGITLEQTQAAFNKAHNLGIATTGAFILGYPSETLGEMWQTIKFSMKLDPSFAQFCILTPYPGTPLYDELKAKRLLLTEDWDKYSTLEPIIEYKAFGYTVQTVRAMLRNAYLFFYLRPKYLLTRWHLIPTILKSLVIRRLKGVL